MHRTKVLIIPNSIERIEEYAFAGCKNITTILINNFMPIPICSNTFDSINKNTCELIVPLGSKYAYQTANFWKEFVNIKESAFISFNSKGGTIINDTIADSNKYIQQPKKPIKQNYAFAGWYIEESYINAWNFFNDTVNENITLYAKWSHSVSFNTIGGSTIKDTIVNCNALISKPVTPIKSGYSFIGWYKEDSDCNIWDFDSDSVITN